MVCAQITYRLGEILSAMPFAVSTAIMTGSKNLASFVTSTSMTTKGIVCRVTPPLHRKANDEREKTKVSQTAHNYDSKQVQARTCKKAAAPMRA